MRLSASKMASKLSASLQQEITLTLNNPFEDCDRGESPYYENIPSAVYKLVFSPLSVTDLKNVRLVCKKWFVESFLILESKSCFKFIGGDNPSELSKARTLSSFLNVVPKDSFQWKMLKALYPKPEEALPVPVLIQWSTLHVVGAVWLELRQWVSRIHTPNVTHLVLINVRLNWVKYLLIFRELESLSVFQDTALSLDSGIWEEFERGIGFGEKLTLTQTFASNFSPNCPELTFHSSNIKEIKIRRTRLEELITFLKLFHTMEICGLESLELSAEDLFRSCLRTKKRSTGKQLGEIKSVLFSQLASLLSRNGECLKSLKISFRQTTISSWFEQYTKEKYNDSDTVIYKPDLRDLLIFIKANRWIENVRFSCLETLVLEMENRKIPTVEEIEYLSSFLCGMKDCLKFLSISHFLLTSYNFLSIPTLLSKLPKELEINLGLSLRANDVEETKGEQLPSNLGAFYDHIRSIIVTCPMQKMDVRHALFPWGRKKEEKVVEKVTKKVLPPAIKSSLLSASASIQLETEDLNPFRITKKVSGDNIQDLWVIDEREGPNPPLFFAFELVTSYPNLVTLILRDSGSGLGINAKDLCRWRLLDDLALQQILESLKKLKHLECKGNLFFISDAGLTGATPGDCERGEFSENDCISFQSLKYLEFCSLEVVGPRVTINSLFHGGWGQLDNLKYLKISGLIDLEQDDIAEWRKNFPNKRCFLDIRTQRN